MKIVVVTISNRNPDPEATDSIANLKLPVVRQRSVSEVSLARNLVLTSVCELQADNQWDCALLVDDDMVFRKEDVAQLVTHALQHGRAVSGCYVLADGVLAAAPWEGRWVTGLGFLAVPMAQLLDLYEKSPKFILSRTGRRGAVFTQAGLVGDHWRSEDYQLCMRLGGVDLIPVRVGHAKVKVLYPAADGLAEFIEQKQREAAAAAPTA